MIGSSRKIEVLFRNHQWMVQVDDGRPYIIEVKEIHCDEDEDDEEIIAERERMALDGGYWIRVSDFRYVTEGHNMIRHVCEKTWVDIDAFEEVVKTAIAYFGIRPNYDVAEEFALARRAKRRAVA